MLELNILPPLIALEINLLLGGFALVNHRRGRVYLFFAAFALAATAWCLGAVLFSVLPFDWHRFALRLCFVGGTAVAWLYAAFCRERIGRPLGPRGLILAAAAWGVVLAVAEINLDLRPLDPRLFTFIQAALVFVYFSGCYLAAFLSLRPRISTSSGREREELEFIFFSGAVPLGLVLVYALVSWAGAAPPANLLLPVTVTAELMLYHAVRYRRVEVEDLLSKTLLYVTFTVIITGVLFIGLFVAVRIFHLGAARHVTVFELLGLVAFCLLSAWAFVVMKDRAQRLIDRLLFPEKVEYRKMILAYEEELKTAREELHRAERLAMVGELSARIAHEIKNPLGPIKGYTQMLKDARARGPVPEAALDKALAIIAEEAEKIDERVRRFLDLARRDQPAREEVRLHPFIDRTLALLESRPGLAVVRDYGPEPLTVFIDPAQFQGALYNLFVNAAQAMSGGGTLTVATRREPDAVIITVADDGPGIAAEVMPRLFEPFASGRPGGTGLGLAIAKSIIEANGGTISAANEKPGAVFRIRLAGAVRPGE